MAAALAAIGLFWAILWLHLSQQISLGQALNH
jgi:hypothetical protein